MRRIRHGSEPYPLPSRGARKGRLLALAALGLALVLTALPAGAAPRRGELKAKGSWRTFEIKAPEQVVGFIFEITAGCRYRLTAQGTTLERLLVEVGPGQATIWRADSRPPDPTATPEGEAPAPGETVPAPRRPDQPEAVVEWYAENDDVFEARVRGFSAMTGRGKVRLETLGPDGERVKAHRRLLAPGRTLAQVGSLWVGEPNRWDLVVSEGRTYEVRSLPGTAGRIALAVKGDDGQLLGEGVPTPTAPFPRLRFTVPLPPPPTADPEAKVGPVAWRLEVVTAGGGGGTYGVRLVENPPSPTVNDTDPDLGSDAPAPPPAVASGLIAGPGLRFGANPGDVAYLYLPRSQPYNPHHLQVQDGTRWQTLPQDPSTTWGQRASMRTPEQAAMVWFRTFVPGTFRFVEPADSGAILQVFPAADVPDAPLLVGTGHDPSIPAKAPPRTWKTIGIGVCMPGWDYLFVAVGRRRAAVSMRVKDLTGGKERIRPKQGTGATRVAGLGPSLRFKVKGPALVLLQVKGKNWEGYALLRRAGN